MERKILNTRQHYKPFDYPWAYEAFEMQQRMFWTSNEIVFDSDVYDWNHKLSASNKNLITQVFRFFVQGDVNIAQAYMDFFIPVFRMPEFRLMFANFVETEARHIQGYSKLLDVIGMPDVEYSAFMDYKEMSDKHDFFYKDLDGMTEHEILAYRMAIFSTFGEGMQLFSSFAILLSFSKPGNNLLTKMGRVVTWSIKDECVSEDTEVLTSSGWVKFPELKPEQQVAQYDPETREISYVVPSRIVKNLYEGYLIHIHDEDGYIDQLMTPNHRILYNHFGDSDSHTLKECAAKNFNPDPATSSITSIDFSEHGCIYNDYSITGKKYEPYVGYVYCVTVPTGAFVIRRNGAVSITGNCLHVESMLKLFHSFLDEYPEVWTENVKAKIYQACRDMVALEDAFIDRCFELGDLDWLKAEDVKKYIRFIADRRLVQLGLKPNYGIPENPFPWIETMINLDEFVNFFEAEVTEYSVGMLKGDLQNVKKNKMYNIENIEKSFVKRLKTVEKQ